MTDEHLPGTTPIRPQPKTENPVRSTYTRTPLQAVPPKDEPELNELWLQRITHGLAFIAGLLVGAHWL